MRELVLDLLAEADDTYDFIAVVYDCIIKQPRPVVIDSGNTFQYANPSYSFRAALDDLDDWDLLKVYQMYCTPANRWHEITDSIWELKDRIQAEKGLDQLWTSYLWQNDHPCIMTKETEEIG